MIEQSGECYCQTAINFGDKKQHGIIFPQNPAESIRNRMRLHEYQSKRIFGKYGIPIPKAKTTTSASQIKQITEELGTPVILKSQVRVNGRGKAGGIRLARDIKRG